jgi:putative transposase
MARHKPAAEPLPTIWNVPDDLWADFIEPILRRHDPEPHTGRPRIDQRKALDGIIYVMRTGCQWNALPKTFGDDSSVHRTFQRWVELGIFRTIWAAIAESCDELDGGVGFDWQSSDTSMGKARFGGIKSAPIPRIEPRTAASAAC